MGGWIDEQIDRCMHTYIHTFIDAHTNTRHFSRRNGLTGSLDMAQSERNADTEGGRCLTWREVSESRWKPELE